MRTDPPPTCPPPPRHGSRRQLYRKFRNGENPKQTLGASRDYNIDLVPKLMYGP